MILIDNGASAIPFVGSEGDNLYAKMNNIVFYGETDAHECAVPNTCLNPNETDLTLCIDRHAIEASAFTQAAKAAFI